MDRISGIEGLDGMGGVEVVGVPIGIGAHGPKAGSSSPKSETHSLSAPNSPLSKTALNRATKTPQRKSPIPPPPRATASSSSGYPGVSWNKRMGAWLSFYYDCDTRRSRTFHPKYYEFDVEKAKQAAIEFMKNIENHPRCSLRKSKKESKYVNPAKQPYELDSALLNIPARNRKRGANHHITGMDYKNRCPVSPLSCQNTQSSMVESYDLESLKRQFHINAGAGDSRFVKNTPSAESDYLSPHGNILENNYLSGSFETQQDYDNYYQSPISWPSSKKSSSQEYYMDAQNYGMPFLEGDVIYPSPNSSVYNDGEMMLSCSCGHSQRPQPQQQPQMGPPQPPANSHMCQSPVYGETAEASGVQGVAIQNPYDGSPINEDSEIQMLMKSIGLSPNDSLEGFCINNVNYGDGSGHYGPAVQQYSNGGSSPLGSPFLTPYDQTVYQSSCEETDLNKKMGFPKV